MKTRERGLLCIGFFLIGRILGFGGQDRPKTPVALDPAVPIADILNVDGTLRLGDGVKGSFDPSGYRMVSEPGKPPRFVPESAPLVPGTVAEAASPTPGGYWDDRFGASGASDFVAALAVQNGTLYAGGAFTLIGGVAVNHVAKWDGTSWSSLGLGTNNYVYALAVSGTDLYAGGWFTAAGGIAANHVAKWNGTSWSPLGSGTNGYVYTLAVSGTDIYAGGAFTTAGGTTASYIAKWDGTSWSPLGSGMNGNIYALLFSGTDLYAGGAFTTADGATADHIAKWNGASWSPVGPGTNDWVYALVALGTDLYAGGNFTTAGGIAANYIAKWDGTAWSPLAVEVNNTVLALQAMGSDLYASGYFLKAGESPVNYIAKWDGTAWSPLGSGLNFAQALAVSGTYLYAGGSFTATVAEPINRIARWDGVSWTPLDNFDGLGMNSYIQGVAVSGTNIFVCGNFTSAGGTSANYIAKWDGTTWAPLGSGMNGWVYALAVSGSSLYAGGNFTTAGGVAANYIAKWDGTVWSPLGSGMDKSVSALAVSGTNLYAGGSFTEAGGIAANYIAKWDGTAWSPLGSGMSGNVRALAVSDTDLFAGGEFATAGGAAVNYIAKWDGTAWSSLGSGMNNWVSALSVLDNDLYAGGYFTSAGGVAANYIAKWDGAVWWSLDSGVDGPVSALAVSETDLYVGGAFATAGSVPAGRVAKWGDSAWSPLSSGIGGSVNVLAVSGGDLAVGGAFGTAGGKPSAHFAIWHPLGLISPNGGESLMTGSSYPVTWSSSDGLSAVKLDYSTDGGTNWTMIVSSTPNDGSYDWTIPGVLSANCLVRVSDASDADAFDASDAVFSIVPIPALTVTAPNGGESWQVAGVRNIMWTSAGAVGDVKLEYSTDGGTGWTTIVASMANSGTYAWTVPDAVSASCLVRVSGAASGTPADASDAVFSIVPISTTMDLSRTLLNFGASGEVTTSDQTILITNMGPGSLNWTATPSARWIKVSPGSGTGSGIVTIGVDSAGLEVGGYDGTVEFTASNATNSPRTVEISLRVYTAGNTAAPFGDFATPISGTTNVTGAIPVTGWILDDIETTKVEIWRDPVLSAGEVNSLYFIGNAIFVEGARPDVEVNYPTYPLNYRAGWGYMLLTNFLPSKGNGTYKLYAIATDVEGNNVTLGSKTIVCDNEHAVKPFGTIDTPMQGGEASGNPYVNFGWVLTPLPKTVPKDGSTILVYVDSVPAGTLESAPNVYNQYRVDVSTNFPGLNNSSGPVGAFFLDTTAYENGVHTIWWIAYDDQGSGDGIGSRYFTIANTDAEAEGGPAPKDLTEVVRPYGKFADIAGFSRALEPVNLRTGFDLRAEAGPLSPSADGIYAVPISETDRVDLDLGRGNKGPVALGLGWGATRFAGYLIVGEELRPLPIGSTLDRWTGRFSWMPGPGFLGSYDFVFIERDFLGHPFRSYMVRVEITPKR